MPLHIAYLEHRTNDYTTDADMIWLRHDRAGSKLWNTDEHDHVRHLGHRYNGSESEETLRSPRRLLQSMVMMMMIKLRLND